MRAITVPGITISRVERFGGVVCLVSGPCVDYEDYQKFPAVVKYQRQLFGKTSWSSDTCDVVYRSDAKIALEASNG